jgi:DHA2 family multidrug resistance protein
MVPLSALATAGMAKGRESGSASALFNMMRNLGGSFGIAGLSTLLSVRERFHSVRIGESVSVYAEATRDRLAQVSAFFLSKGADAGSAHMQAVIAIDRSVRRQSFLMSYNDCFVVLGCILLSSGVAVFFMRKAQVAGGGGGH